MDNVYFEHLGDGIEKSAIYSKYEVLSTLDDKENTGTFLVREKRTGVIYAKKIITNEQHTLYKELQQIDCQHLNRVIELYEFSKCSIVIKDYIPGRTLSKILEEEGVIPEAQAIIYMKQLCIALQALHKHNIIHRDVNPNNIIISTDNILKLIDLDISRFQKDSKSQDTTIMGTAGYAAPEQFGFSQTDRRSDIYSLGVLFNVMLTGEYPSTKLAGNVLHRNIIVSCISAEPNARYESVKLIFKELESLSKNHKEKERSLAKMIPGFRTGKWYKKILAIICYSFLLISLIIVVQDQDTMLDIIENIIIWVSVFLLPFLLLTNVGYFDRRIRFLRLMSKRNAFFTRIGLSLISWWIYILFVILKDVFSNVLF